jgi:hypothetical protein
VRGLVCWLVGHRPESMPWEADNPNPELYGLRCLRCGAWLEGALGRAMRSGL